MATALFIYFMTVDDFQESGGDKCERFSRSDAMQVNIELSQDIDSIDRVCLGAPRF